ncbi:permease for cytosine/purines, uracil, thiamine, allantoin-domain-containing protein [Gautieria morchelliformis]|nr:permease for cytosine/purines, uracil, thiamine, allantoin-domain-containing protein [Gautieria morchelliformis]
MTFKRSDHSIYLVSGCSTLTLKKGLEAVISTFDLSATSSSFFTTMSNSSFDKEKAFEPVGSIPVAVKAEDEGQIRARLGRYGLGKLFDAGVEARGIERVPEYERQNKHAIGLILFWFSVNIVLTTLPIGMLAQQIFTLTFPHAVGVIVGFATIGSTAAAFVAMLGPRFGMRTMVITRYAFGYWGATFVCLLNILTELGFSVIAVILAGQVLHNVNPHMPLVVGVILIGLISVLICFIGYDFLHHYERYAWLLMSVLFIIVYALGGHAGYEILPQVPLEAPAGHLRAADILSFGGVVFSSSAGWAPVAADFNCRLPVNTRPTKIFMLTFLGILLPIVFIMALGAVLMTVPAYAEAYINGEAAGVLSKVFEPWGRGGDFVLVLLSLSVIANNIPNTYSTGLSMQTLIPPFRHIPRAIFTVLAFIIYTVAGVAGRQHFTIFLNNFLAVLGYWLSFWVVILLEEHYIFRRKDGVLGGYDLDAYDTPRLLPVGLAAIFASLCGIGGAVISMAQVWYIGPVAAKLGPFGGDMGFEFAAVFTGVVYPPLRWLEIRKWGR